VSNEQPELGEVLEFPDGQADGDRRWLVLFDEDYYNHAVDVEGNVGVLVDIHQAGEVIRLAAQALADLSHQDADGDDVLRDMIDALEAEIEDSDRDGGECR
jgi:hypothetical protein